MHVHSQRADVHVSGVCWCELARDGPGGCVYRSTVSCQISQIAKPPVPMWTLVTHTHTHTLQALPHPASCPRCKNSNHALILGRLLLSFPFFNCPFLPSSFPLSLFGTEVTLVRTCSSTRGSVVTVLAPVKTNSSHISCLLLHFSILVWVGEAHFLLLANKLNNALLSRRMQNELLRNSEGLCIF